MSWNSNSPAGMKAGVAWAVVAFGVCLALLTGPAAGVQDKPTSASDPEVTLKASADVVNVYAVVRDKKRLIANLHQEDFELAEDNVPQQIRYFTRETDTSLTIVLLIDTSGSVEHVLRFEQEAAKNFFGQVIRPKDLAAVLNFDLDVEMLQDFTSNVDLLSRAVDQAEINTGGGGVVQGPFPTPGIGGTHLYDAVYMAAHDLLKNEVGRKVIILLSDGVDQGSRMKLNEALEAAQKADVIVYSVPVIDREFLFGHFGVSGGESVLRKISEETGGSVIEVSRARETPQAFEEIAKELRTQYLLGYTPSNSRHDGAFRKIRARVRDKSYKVQARRGYYAPAE